MEPNKDSQAAPTATDAAPAVGEPAAEAEKPKGLLDEVTGEYVSKNELKKRKKMREKEEKKAKKDAEKAAKSQNSNVVDPNKYN